MKKVLITLVILILIILGFAVYKFNFTNKDIYAGDVVQSSPHDGTYMIAGQNVILKNGISEVAIAPGSSTKIVTKYFGNDLKRDINGDGVMDDIFLVTQDRGGSGVFYFVTALVSTPNGLVGSDAVFLGDRIAPQNIEINETNGRKNVIVVNYADRKKGEAFTIAPSVGKSLWIKLDIKTMQFGIVEQNFEGEADPARMSLDMKKWEWIKTQYSDGKIIPAFKQNKFSMTFKKDNTFSATTDCNGIGGEYMVKDNKITFSNMISTMMYCDGSQEAVFTKMLNETQGYLFTSKGELVLTLKFDSGSMFFK